MPEPTEQTTGEAKEKEKADEFWKDTPQHTRDFAERQCAMNRAREEKAAREKEARTLGKKVDGGPDEEKTCLEQLPEQMAKNTGAAPRPEAADMCPVCPYKKTCPAESPDAADLKECCFEMRDELLTMINRLGGLIVNHPAMMAGINTETKKVTPIGPDNALRNALLSYQGLEDALMRLGKVVEVLDDGQSKYAR